MQCAHAFQRACERCVRKRQRFTVAEERIRAMQRDGQLITGRQGALGLPKKMDLVKCRIIGHRDGYGFASPIERGRLSVEPPDVPSF